MFFRHLQHGSLRILWLFINLSSKTSDTNCFSWVLGFSKRQLGLVGPVTKPGRAGQASAGWSCVAMASRAGWAGLAGLRWSKPAWPRASRARPSRPSWARRAGLARQGRGRAPSGSFRMLMILPLLFLLLAFSHCPPFVTHREWYHPITTVLYMVLILPDVSIFV